MSLPLVLHAQIRGIDDDEAEFLERVDDIRCRIEREKRLEERKELEEYRKSQAEFREKELENRLKETANPSPLLSKPASNLTKSKSSSAQSKLLLGAVKRPNTKEPSGETKAKVSRTEESQAGASDDSAAGPTATLGALAGIGDDYDSSSETESS